MEVEVRTEFYDKDLRGYGVVGEIPGTDKANEVVMLRVPVLTELRVE